MRFFQKIGKFGVFSTKLTIISINLCRKIRKIGFSPNKYEFSQIISTNNCMWIDISTIAKTIIFSTQTEVEIFHKLFFHKTIHNYCRKHRKFAKFVILHNRIQISEKFSPIISKGWHFLKCHSNCSTYKAQIAHTQIIKSSN